MQLLHLSLSKNILLFSNNFEIINEIFLRLYFGYYKYNKQGSIFNSTLIINLIKDGIKNTVY